MSSQAESWDADLADRATPAPLLQSWAWGEIQARAGWSVERVRFSPGGPMASIQVRKVGPSREAYIPRGPVPATFTLPPAPRSTAQPSAAMQASVLAQSAPEEKFRSTDFPSAMPASMA